MEQAITWLAIVSIAVPLTLWAYIAMNRSRLPASSIPDQVGIKLGLLIYIWSDAHVRAEDLWLSRLVRASRIAFVMQCLTIILYVFITEP